MTKENDFDIKGLEISTNWLTRKQTSKYLQCGLSTLDNCISIKKYYLGKSVRYLKSDVDEYLLSHCRDPIKKEKTNGRQN